jgi:ferric-dicitrate binding protein FerR (iron transport regulator)
MYNLLEKYFTGEIKVNEKQALFSEIEKNPELKVEFIRMQNLKGMMSLSRFNTNEELAGEKLNGFYSGILRQKRRYYFLQFTKYAAVVAIVALCTFFGINYFSNKNQALYSEIEVPVGQRVFLTLSDGSTVWLNSRSKIRIPQTFEGKYRKVYLDGEAFFEVEKNKDIPFIVETSRYDVKVLGTKFNVLNYSGMTVFETTLVEGSVEVSKAGKEDTIILTPNEQVTLVDNHLQKAKVNSDDYSSWKNGVLTFDSEPLSEIIKKLELYYDVRFIVQNTQALDVIYTGKFKSKDSAEKIIDVIQKTNKFNYRVSSDNKIIYIQ